MNVRLIRSVASWEKSLSAVLALALRVLGVGGAGLLTGWLVNALRQGGGGADIGAGLLSFLVFILISFAWAFVDGRRTTSLRRTLGIWAVAAVLVAVAVVLGVQVNGAGFDGSVLRSDLFSLAPMVVGLILVPALVGATIGSATSSPQGKRHARG